MSSTPKPVALIILDGFGHSEEQSADNAIAQAKMPCWDYLKESYSSTLLECSGEKVGLPAGQMGNSEVGHLHIGSGQFVPQDFLKVDIEIENGNFFENQALIGSVDHALENDSALHIMGLLSQGGVHSHERQIYAMIELARRKGLNKIFVHAFLDGRDVPPKSADVSLKRLQDKIDALGVGHIASVIGRFYVMDRDNNWDRIEKAYQLLVQGQAQFSVDTAEQAINEAYARGETDEFIQATSVLDQAGEAVKFNDNDAVVFMNFRADRAREIVRSFAPDFSEFDRQGTPPRLFLTTLVEYHKDFEFPVAYHSQRIVNGFGEVLANKGLKQLRLAETEKYAHVTFFFNGGVEEPNKGEDRILIPSPKVKTYDLQPEMSAEEVTDRLVEAIEGGHYDAIVCNYANCDMVGHTGNLEASIKAVEMIDRCLERVYTALKGAGGEMLITADHGNIEKLFDEGTQQSHTAHTSNLVPLVYVGADKTLSEEGSLTDLAPTLLTMMGIEKPEEMTGTSLL